MLKRDIKYEDFNGVEVVEPFYFNLTRSEIVTLEVEETEGLRAMLQKMIDSQDNKNIWAKFKEIILLAYGEKSEDGKRFVKNDEIRENFSQTAAFDALLTELISNEEAASVFIIGIMPKDLAAKVDQDKPVGLPQAAPTPPTT